MRVATAPAVTPPAGGSPHHHTTHMTHWSPTSSPPGVVVDVGGPASLPWWNDWTNTTDEEARALLDVDETVDADDGTLSGGNWTLEGGNWTMIDGNWTMMDGNWTLVGGNWTEEEGATLSMQVMFTAITAVILGVMILATIIGNVFVIAAILLERNLQSVANYLILSLAVADLLVAALVMPLGAVYEVSKEWTLGPELCDMWTASDVLCCTASILHLVAIALDRFWAVTKVDYIHQRSPKRVGGMIAVIWSVSFLISAAPMMGWKDPEWHERLRNKMCIISQDVGYQIFATITSFYLPLAVILVLYWRVYQAARKRIRRKIGTNAHSALCRGPVTISETTTFTRMSSQPSPEKTSNGSTLNGHPVDGGREDTTTSAVVAAVTSAAAAQVVPRHLRRREVESRKERKAAKTLGIITGAFVMCWLPFFILAVLMPLCTVSCHFNPYLIATFLWLGYFNSTLNPIIYTVFSPEFRNAFKRILCGRKRPFQRQSSRFSSVRFTRS
uniref:Putative serotonin receptor 1B n=3 Tax=Homarus americanus TaxID=6706 RepID=A0A6H0DU69_HOMAM|nr:putative serotonin receptor 1B [Homarus americanus]